VAIVIRHRDKDVLLLLPVSWDDLDDCGALHSDVLVLNYLIVKPDFEAFADYSVLMRIGK